MPPRRWTLRVAEAIIAVGCVTIVGCAPAHRRNGAEQLKSDTAVVRKEVTAQNLEELGVASAGVGDTTRAEQYFSAALKAGGDPLRLTERLIQICVAEGRYPVALMYAEDHLSHHPEDTDVRFAMATLSAAVGDTGVALDGFERVVAERPELADAHFALASLLQKAGMDPYRADEHYRTYLRLQPKGVHAEVARASLLKSVRSDK